MIKEYIQESIDVKSSLLNDESLISTIEDTIKILIDCFRGGNKILIAGNGGSAADAQHFVAEIVSKYKRERKGYPAIALTVNSSILTAWSNDYDFQSVFARQIEALGSAHDVFLGISTSGNSENVYLAVLKAKEKGLKTICLLGNGGGKLKDISHISLIVPSDNTPRIQEAHIMIIHIICEEVEKSFKD